MGGIMSAMNFFYIFWEGLSVVVHINLKT